MNLALLDSELGFNFRLFCKTNSSSASWGFDRFRLFNPKWHTKIQVRRPDGSIVATKDFSTALSFEHNFSFNLSENTTNQEYSVYIAGVPEGAQINQVYAWPSGYGASTGKDADITFWDFSQANVFPDSTSGRLRFQNQPLHTLIFNEVGGQKVLNCDEVRFPNCQLNAETLADLIIAVNNSGITGGSLEYQGNLAPPAERALSAYNNLKDVKAWSITGDAPNTGIQIQAETTAYINRVNTDTGVVINEAYIDTVYSQLKADASLANLLFWMDSKGGMKKDASNFISKTYDLSNSLNDPTQITGALQPISNTGIVFDGSNDSLNSSFLILSIGTTLYVKFTPQAFGDMLLGINGNTNAYLFLFSSTNIRLQGVTSGVSSWGVPSMVVGTEQELFIQRNSTGYHLFLNAVSYGEKASTVDVKFDKIGNYDAVNFAYNGRIQKMALFNEILTTTKMNNLIAI